MHLSIQTSYQLHTSAFVLAVLFALQSTASNAEPIGKTTSVRPDAHVNTQMLASGSGVNSNDTIRTGSVGAADLRFKDDSNLSVGPTSDVRLNKFVYDPNKSSGMAVMEMSRGAFRFVTGSQSKGNYQLKTPYGTLGVRG